MNADIKNDNPDNESENTSSFSRYLQQEMNDNLKIQNASNHFNSGFGNKLTPKSNKNKGKLTAAVIITILFLSVGIVSAQASQDTLQNAYIKLTKSPEEYYNYVEAKAIYKTMDKLMPYLHSINLDAAKTAIIFDMNVSINRNPFDSIMDNVLGTRLTDIERELGFPLDNVGIHLVHARGDNSDLIADKLDIRLNQVKLFSTELLHNTASRDLLLRLPKLSPSYVRLTESYMSSTDSYLRSNDFYQSNDTNTDTPATTNYFTSQATLDFLKKYGTLITDCPKQVTMEEQTTLTLDRLSVSCTKFTVSITEKDLNHMFRLMLTQAMEDEYILNLLPYVHLTTEEYQTYITDTIAKLPLEASTSSDRTIQMNVYVDQKGTILGRDIRNSENDTSFNYNILSDDSYEEYRLEVNDEGGNNLIKMNGHHSIDKNIYTGTAIVNIPKENSTDSVTDITFTYEDIHTVYNDNIPYQYGEILISSIDLMGVQIMMNFDVMDNKQISKTIFTLGAEPLVTLETSGEYTDQYDMGLPADISKIYKFEDVHSYLDALDTEKYISDLSEELDIDVQSLLNKDLSSQLNIHLQNDFEQYIPKQFIIDLKNVLNQYLPEQL